MNHSKRQHQHIMNCNPYGLIVYNWLLGTCVNVLPVIKKGRFPNQLWKNMQTTLTWISSLTASSNENIYFPIVYLASDQQIFGFLYHMQCIMFAWRFLANANNKWALPKVQLAMMINAWHSLWKSPQWSYLYACCKVTCLYSILKDAE